MTTAEGRFKPPGGHESVIADARNALTSSPASLHLLDPLRPLIAEFPLTLGERTSVFAWGDSAFGSHARTEGYW